MCRCGSVSRGGARRAAGFPGRAKKIGRYVGKQTKNLRYLFESVGGKHKTKLVHVSKESTTEVNLFFWVGVLRAVQLQSSWYLGV
jgi:hypothetical protein